MAKKGFRFESTCCFHDRCIAIDKEGIPWVIDPKAGTVALAKIELPAEKQAAVKKHK